MINITAEDAKLFEQNGFTREQVGATVRHYREQGLSDDDIQAKMNERISQFKSAAPEIANQKGIDLTPSGLLDKSVNAVGSAILTPAVMLKDKETNPIEAYKKAYDIGEQSMASARKESPVLSNIVKTGTDLLGYSALPVLRGGGLGNFAGNAVIQGGIPGALEALKRDENVIGGGGLGTGIAAGLSGLLKGAPLVTQGLKNVIDNPNFQSGLTKGLEAFTSVPQEYTQRALDAELAGNSLFNGKFDKKTAYRPIEEKIKQAKDMLPSAESYANEFYKLGQKAKTNIENLKEAAGTEISDMLGSLQAEPIQINGLKNSIDSLIKSYSRGGDINPAEIRAGRDLELVRDMLGMKGKNQTNQELTNYFNANKFGANGGEQALNKEAENIAFDILSQATGKNKKWLQSQLNANMPKMSTQKRQEFIQELLENTDDKIQNIDPSWRQYFPEFNWENLQEGGADTTELTRNVLQKIMGRDFKKPTELLSPQEQAIEELSSQYNKILGEVAANPSNQAVNNSYNQLLEMLKYTPDELKDDLVTKYANDIESLQNIVNPKVKPIDLHNAKEILYDMANYDTAGGTRNDVLKGVANQINNFLRTKYPQYKAPNDKFAMIKTLENNLGGLNSSTIGNKLANYGKSGNLVSGLDQKLRDINNVLPLNQQFINDTKNLVDSQNEVNEILKAISQKYEDNPRPLADKVSQRFENAINNLQTKTGVNFMDELNNIRAREAMENLFPGQGGGSGSSQGFGNLLRTAIVGGTPTAAVITQNPLALGGFAAISPKIMAKGTVQNLGKLYKNLGKDIPDSIKRLLNPLAVMSAGPMLYGQISND